jgi:hypothetical protein
MAFFTSLFGARLDVNPSPLLWSERVRLKAASDCQQARRAPLQSDRQTINHATRNSAGNRTRLQFAAPIAKGRGSDVFRGRDDHEVL